MFTSSWMMPACSDTTSCDAVMAAARSTRAKMPAFFAVAATFSLASILILSNAACSQMTNLFHLRDHSAKDVTKAASERRDAHSESVLAQSKPNSDVSADSVRLLNAAEPQHFFSRDKIVQIRRPAEYSRRIEMPLAIWWSDNNGFSWNLAGYFEKGQRTFPLEVEADGDYGIRFLSVGQTPVRHSSTAPRQIYHVDTRPPRIRLAIDPQQDKYRVGDMITLSWIAEDQHLSDNPVTIGMLTDSFVAEQEPVELQRYQSADGKITYRLPAEALGRKVTFRVSAKDHAGNVGTSDSFALDVVDPTVNVAVYGHTDGNNHEAIESSPLPAETSSIAPQATANRPVSIALSTEQSPAPLAGPIFNANENISEPSKVVDDEPAEPAEPEIKSEMEVAVVSDSPELTTVVNDEPPDSQGPDVDSDSEVAESGDCLETNAEGVLADSDQAPDATGDSDEQEPTSPVPTIQQVDPKQIPFATSLARLPINNDELLEKASRLPVAVAIKPSDEDLIQDAIDSEPEAVDFSQPETKIPQTEDSAEPVAANDDMDDDIGEAIDLEEDATPNTSSTDPTYQEDIPIAAKVPDLTELIRSQNDPDESLPPLARSSYSSVDFTQGNGLLVPLPATVEKPVRGEVRLTAHPWRILGHLWPLPLRVVWDLPIPRPNFRWIPIVKGRFLADNPLLRAVAEPAVTVRAIVGNTANDLDPGYDQTP